MVTPQAKRWTSRSVGPRRGVVCGVVLVAALLALAAPAQAAPQFTPLIATVLAQPAPVKGTDGRIHVVYEILLQNDAGVHVDVLSLAVRTGRGRPLLRVAGDQVPTVMTTFARQPTASLEASEGGKLWLDLVLRRARQVPSALVHRMSVRATLGGETRDFTFDAARTRVTRRQAVSLAPPLRGGQYLNFNGCCGLSPHRTAIAGVDGTPWLSERFASDFIQIDAQGRGGAGDLSRNESFFTFGDPVYAVAGGRVVSTRNDQPENTPLMEPAINFTPQTTLGNNVVVRLRGGRYALFAHLERGSVRVRRGQRVRTGDVLGRVGNSGDTGGPHLHFQLSDGPDPVASDGVPYTFARFGLVGSVTNVEQFLTGQAPADIQRLDPVAQRRGELPLQSTVVRFGG